MGKKNKELKDFIKEIENLVDRESLEKLKTEMETHSIDEARISELVELIRKNALVRRFVEGKQIAQFPIDVEAFEQALCASLELILDHFTQAIKRIKFLESQYEKWWYQIKLYDAVTKYTLNQSDVPENVKLAMKHLGYKTEK